MTIRSTVFLAALFAPMVMAGAQRPEQTSEFRWSERVDAGRTVKVTNVNGTVTVRAGGGDRVEVTAVKRWRRGDPAAVKIYAQRQGGDIRVCPLYQGNEECDHQRWTGRRDRDDEERDDDVRVDFTVLVPRGVRVVAATVNGPVSVTGATEDVEAATVNGDVTVESGRGRLSGTTVSGTVRATIMTRPSDIQFTTVNGSIIADLASSIGLDVEMTTLNGSLRGDYDLTSRSRRFNPFNFNGHIGPSGGPRMQVTTLNGDVVLRKR
jgi:hypothetical protein